MRTPLTFCAVALAIGAAPRFVVAQSPAQRPATSSTTADPGALAWVRIPAGTFSMGCVEGDADCFANEKPAHKVTFTRGFDMLATEVTLGQWRAHKRPALPEQPKWNTASQQPVVNVTRGEAEEFCTAIGGRLPTEAEWEYAARGGKSNAIFPWGSAASHDEANYGADACCKGLAQGRDRWVETAPVGSFSANGFGLFDMAGNVYEWVSDWYDAGRYKRGDVSDPPSSDVGERWIARGGAWDGTAGDLRLSNRNYIAPRLTRYPDVGFRCVRAAEK